MEVTRGHTISAGLVNSSLQVVPSVLLIQLQQLQYYGPNPCIRELTLRHIFDYCYSQGTEGHALGN